MHSLQNKTSESITHERLNGDVFWKPRLRRGNKELFDRNLVYSNRKGAQNTSTVHNNVPRQTKVMIHGGPIYRYVYCRAVLIKSIKSGYFQIYISKYIIVSLYFITFKFINKVEPILPYKARLDSVWISSASFKKALHSICIHWPDTNHISAREKVFRKVIKFCRPTVKCIVIVIVSTHHLQRYVIARFDEQLLF